MINMELDKKYLEKLKKDIECLTDMERCSGSMDLITRLYVSRMLNVPLEKVERVMKDMVLWFLKLSPLLKVGSNN